MISSVFFPYCKSLIFWSPEKLHYIHLFWLYVLRNISVCLTLRPSLHLVLRSGIHRSALNTSLKEKVYFFAALKENLYPMEKSEKTLNILDMQNFAEFILVFYIHQLDKKLWSWFHLFHGLFTGPSATTAVCYK